MLSVKVLNVRCAHLIAGISSKTIAVVFNLYFDVVGGALLIPAQALFMRREDNSLSIHCNNQWEITTVSQPEPVRLILTLTLPLDQPIRSSIFWPNLESSLLQALFLGSTDHFCFLRAVLRTAITNHNAHTTKHWPSYKIPRDQDNGFKYFTLKWHWLTAVESSETEADAVFYTST